MRRLPCLLASLALVALAGCGEPSNYIRPRLAVDPGGRAHLAVQRMAFDLQDPEYRLYAADGPDYAQWREAGRFSGQVATLLADARGLVVVHASGATILMRADGANTLVATAGAHRIGAAAWWPESGAAGGGDDGIVAPGDGTGGRDGGGHEPGTEPPAFPLMAVGEVDEGLQLLRLDGGRWTAAGPPLPAAGGAVWQMQLAPWGDRPVVVWTILPDDGANPRLEAACLVDGAWRAFRLPPREDGAHAAIAADGAGGLWWLAEGEAGASAARTTLDLWHTPPPRPPEATAAEEGDGGGIGDGEDGPAWRADTPIALPAEWQARRGYGLALAAAPGADGRAPALVAVRSDLLGVRGWTGRAEDAGERRWSPGGEVVGQERAESWAVVRLAALMALMAALLIGLRLVRERGPGPLRAAPRPGEYGALVDRALAFVVDMAVVSPLPAMFHAHATDYGMLRYPASEYGRLYWIWLGGLAVYKALMEMRFGDTLGKRLLGLRVRDARRGGGRIRPAQAWGRNLALAADCFPVALGPGVWLPYFVALVAIAFTRRRRRVGDGLAGTVVRRHVSAERRKVALASRSPRRLVLLRAAGLDVAVPHGWAGDGDAERGVAGATPEETARRRAKAKADRAWALAEAGPTAPATAADWPLWTSRPIVVAADTVVDLDGGTLDKPADAEAARAMLARLSGRAHRVHTGLTVADLATGQVMTGVETTEVEFRALTEAEIDAYVATGEPLDKAGAYGVQDGGRAFVKDVRGSLSNVIGLPMEMLGAMFDDLDG